MYPDFLKHVSVQQKTYYWRHIKYYVVSFEILQTLKQNIGESRKQTKMAKTDFTREQVSIKMFTKLILQFKLDQISFTVLIRLSDGNRTPTDFSVLHLCSHHKIFAERMLQGNIGWKIVSCELIATVPVHIKSLNFVLKIMCIEFLQLLPEKNLKRFKWSCWLMCDAQVMLLNHPINLFTIIDLIDY